MIDIKAIKAAAEAATPQPWIDPGEGNMPFICMMTPATVIALCDEIERLTIIASELQDLCDRQAKRLAEVEKDAARLDHVLKWDDGYWTSRLQIDKCIADDADVENMK